MNTHRRYSADDWSQVANPTSAVAACMCISSIIQLQSFEFPSNLLSMQEMLDPRMDFIGDCIENGL
jgi:hypothetical protein